MVTGCEKPCPPCGTTADCWRDVSDRDDLFWDLDEEG